MSGDITFPTTTQAARKSHTCDHCGKPIVIGERYLRTRGVWEGNPGVFRSHVECDEASTAWRDYHDSAWDEGCLLNADVEAEDHEWLIAEFPIVAERLGIATP